MATTSPLMSEPSTLQSVNDKVCLITGGARGLGEGAARHLYLHGAHIAILDLPSTKIKSEELVREFSTERAIFVGADVSEENEVKLALERVVSKFGRIDVVLNNAGINEPHHGVFHMSTGNPYPMDKLRKILDVNVIGVLNILRLTVPILAKNKPNADGERGIIVNTGSISGLDAVTHQIPYVLSKAAVNGITTPLAYELAEHGIRVSCIAPGAFRSTFIERMTPEDLKGHCTTNFFPLRRGTEEEFGHLVRSIVENPMLNGSTIRLDGATRIFWVAKD